VAPQANSASSSARTQERAIGLAFGRGWRSAAAGVWQRGRGAPVTTFGLTMRQPQRQQAGRLLLWRFGCWFGSAGHGLVRSRRRCRIGARIRAGHRSTIRAVGPTLLVCCGPSAVWGSKSGRQGAIVYTNSPVPRPRGSPNQTRSLPSESGSLSSCALAFLGQRYASTSLLQQVCATRSLRSRSRVRQ
jgi:hypothetical protein